MTVGEAVLPGDRTSEPALLEGLGGAAGSTVLPTAELRDGRTTLPLGFTYAAAVKVSDSELAALFRSIGWSQNGEQSLERIRRRMSRRGIESLPIFICNFSNQLIGHSQLFYRGKAGQLCNFVVDPRFHHRGIGKAMLDEHLRLADHAGIESLYISRVSPTNTLKSYYLEKGFRETPRGKLVRGPRPVAMSPLSEAIVDFLEPLERILASHV